jgi:hypothetical protein
MDKTVLNLSKVALNKDQLTVLSKGLNFCPTTDKPDPGQYKIDLDSLHRRLRLRARFTDPDSSLDDLDPSLLTDDSDEPFQHRKFRTPSTFNPVGPPNLEAFITVNEHNFNKIPMFRANRVKKHDPR